MSERVLVTGGNGFLGRHLVRLLRERGQEVIVWSPYYDLTKTEDVDVLLSMDEPTHVYHLAGYNGGIAFNAAQPAKIFYDNTLMALNLLEGCRKHGVKKVLSVVASCAYPAEQWVETPSPKDGVSEMFEMRLNSERQTCPEHEFLDSPPHPSVACHGYAKRNLQLASHFYRQQYGLEAVCVCPTTLYGEGDSYDPERTKVVGAMVKRFIDAAKSGEPEVTCWGSGKPLREFLYAPDCARLLADCMGRWDRSDVPLNLGTGQELSVMELAQTVASCAGYSGRIDWDESKPDGQFRKRLDVTRMRAVLGEFEFTPLEVGLLRTIEDYRREVAS